MTIAHRPTDAIPSRAPEVELNSLIASAKATRGELSAASAAIDAASYALRAAQSGRFPRVSAAISEGNTQPVVQQAYKPQFTFSLQAVWQLFDGGLSDGREAEATANLDEARLQLERLNNDVELGVRQAYATMLAAQARVVAAQALVQSANEGERLSEVRYRGGVGTALELREADLRAIGARREELEAHAALARSVTDLRFASGLL
jgi:outer membrane protein TolC